VDYFSRIITSVRNYFEALKPRETFLITFLGISSSVIAGGWGEWGRITIAGISILLGSAGVNGLTNYLDRELDAKMERTRRRPLPSKRIYPPEKILPLVAILIIIGLVLAWWLHPYAFIAGVVGVIASAVYRKRFTCVFPQGALASIAPILIGWFAISASFSWELVLLCLLIAFWLPLHVWSVMISYRDQYLKAGISFFPIGVDVKDSTKILFAFSLILYITSVALYFAADLGTIYLILANIMGLLMIYSSLQLVRSRASLEAWRLYKLSSFPYLGIIFIAMCLDLLL